MFSGAWRISTTAGRGPYEASVTADRYCSYGVKPIHQTGAPGCLRRSTKPTSGSKGWTILPQAVSRAGAFSCSKVAPGPAKRRSRRSSSPPAPRRESRRSTSRCRKPRTSFALALCRTAGRWRESRSSNWCRRKACSTTTSSRACSILLIWSSAKRPNASSKRSRRSNRAALCSTACQKFGCWRNPRSVIAVKS